MLTKDRRTFIHQRHDPKKPGSLSIQHVWGIFEDSRKRLWVGTWGGGINRYDRRTDRFIQYNQRGYDDSVAKCIYEDSTGVIWVGSKSRGIYRYDETSESFINAGQGLSNSYITSIYEDRGGVLWVGTLSGGVNTFNRNAMRHVIRHYTHNPGQAISLTNPVVWALEEDSEGRLLVGTDDGISRIDFRQQTVTHGLREIKDSVRSVMADHSGSVWAGTLNSGLFQLKKDLTPARQFRKGNTAGSLSDDTVLCIYKDRGKHLWVGTWDGLNRFDRTKESFVQYKNRPDDPKSLSHDVARTILRDRHGRLWVGTNSGLNAYDESLNRFLVYNNDPANPKSLSNDTVRCIHESRNGALWIGTSGGLNLYDRNSDSFTVLRERHGLLNDTIYGILEDDEGHVWLSTNKGLSRFDPRSRVFKNYDVHDGLQSNEFNAGAFAKGENNRLYFGGGKGFNVVFPDRIKDNLNRPPVVLTRFQKNFKDPYPDFPPWEMDRIVLSRKDTVFSLEFAALDYTSPEKNRYKYTLKGFDRGWIDSGHRRIAIYTNLDAGDYTFKVKGSNNDGLWGDESSLAIRITPRWWETGWAKAGLVLLILVFSYELKKFYQLKERFSNIGFMGKYIAHEITNPLVSIRSGSDLLIRHFQRTGQLDKELNTARNILQSVLEAGEAIQAFEDLHTHPRPNIAREFPPFDLLDLTEHMVSDFRLTHTPKPVTFTFKTDLSPPLMVSMHPVDYKIILKNLLKNAVRAVSGNSRKDGSEPDRSITVVISSKKDTKYFAVDIIDTGCGMDKKTLRRCMTICFSTKNESSGLGLSIVQNKVDKYGIKIKITSRENRGTTFRILIPERMTHHGLA